MPVSFEKNEMFVEFLGEALNRGSMDRHPYDIKRIPQPNPFNNIVERREEDGRHLVSWMRRYLPEFVQ
jgi:hypothetical protein